MPRNVLSFLLVFLSSLLVKLKLTAFDLTSLSTT